MKNKKLIFIGLFLLVVMFISGCGSEDINTEDVVNQECPLSCDDDYLCSEDLCSEETNYTCVNEPIIPCCGNDNCEKPDESYSRCSQDCSRPSVDELALSLNDFSEEWEVSTRGERTKSEVSEEGLELGWLEGYNAVFRKIENPDIEVSQHISRYPEENISLTLENSRDLIESFDEDVEGVTKSFDFDNYGRKYRIEGLSAINIGDDCVTLKIVYLDLGSVIYRIDFIKSDYYESFTGYDYELLKELAEKVEIKI